MVNSGDKCNQIGQSTDLHIEANMDIKHVHVNEDKQEQCTVSIVVTDDRNDPGASSCCSDDEDDKNSIDDEISSELVESMSFFLEAYKGELGERATSPQPVIPASVGCHPYVSGLSLPSSSHVKQPGDSDHGDGHNTLRIPALKPASYGRISRSNSMCAEPIAEEADLVSSDEEQSKTTANPDQTIEDEDVNITHKVLQQRRGALEHEDMLFEDRSEPERLSLDDWFSIWSLGKQRHFLSHDQEDESSDLDRVKDMTTKLKLPTRRPSIQVWKETYLQTKQLQKSISMRRASQSKPASKWLSHDAEESKETRSNWSANKVQQINDAISWIREELVSYGITDHRNNELE